MPTKSHFRGGWCCCYLGTKLLAGHGNLIMVKRSGKRCGPLSHVEWEVIYYTLKLQSCTLKCIVPLWAKYWCSSTERAERPVQRAESSIHTVKEREQHLNSFMAQVLTEPLLTAQHANWYYSHAKVVLMGVRRPLDGHIIFDKANSSAHFLIL